MSRRNLFLRRSSNNILTTFLEPKFQTIFLPKTSESASGIPPKRQNTPRVQPKDQYYETIFAINELL